MKKLLTVMTIILGLICLTACGTDNASKQDANSQPDIRDLVSITVPEGYIEDDETQDNTDEIVTNLWWTRDDTSTISLDHVAYKGKPVKEFESSCTIDEILNNDCKELIGEKDINGTHMYIMRAAKDATTAYKSDIEVYFENGDSIFRIEMDNSLDEKTPALSDEQIDEFYKILESVQLIDNK